ncbi:MAG: ABC transporter permease [Chthonomonas sp.]|nr:ABC transporter permease [Chthonomonas sp.]
MIALILLFSTPIALAAIGEVIHQRAGLLNIGLEGTMLGGALAGALVSLTIGDPWLGLLAGIVAGVAIGLLQALFTVWLALDQVVIGTAINLTMLGVTSTVFRAQFGRSGELLSLPELPKIGGIDPVVILMLVLVVGAGWLLRFSRWGLLARASGENPEALRASGTSVNRVRLQAVVLASALAGLGGAHLSIGVAQSFAENMVAGRGFMALAMVTFGRWSPTYAVLAAMLIGLVETLQYRAQAMGWGLPPQLFVSLPYVSALAVLIILGRGTRQPASLGVPYRRMK